MSFQLENSYTQPKNKPLGGGDSTAIPITLDLFHTNQSSPPFKFQQPCPVFPLGLFLGSKRKQKRSLEDNISEEKMGRKNGNNMKNNVSKLDLKLNLSPPNTRTESATRSTSVSPPSSCISSDSSPESSPMVLVGCPRCLMYVMLSEDDPKCPKCKSTVLLDFINNNNNNNCDISGSSKKD